MQPTCFESETVMHSEYKAQFILTIEKIDKAQVEEDKRIQLHARKIRFRFILFFFRGAFNIAAFSIFLKINILFRDSSLNLIYFHSFIHSGMSIFTLQYIFFHSHYDGIRRIL